MANDLSKHKNEVSKIKDNWLNRISQEENPVREVYDLLIDLGQQKRAVQSKRTSD